jgi:hypothetical protein
LGLVVIAGDQITALAYRRDTRQAGVDLAHLVRERLSRLQQAKITNQDRTVRREPDTLTSKPLCQSL